MKTDGTFETLFQQELGVYWDQSCAAVASSATSTASSLDITNVVCIKTFSHPRRLASPGGVLAKNPSGLLWCIQRIKKNPGA
jgi:hypothetical protein